MAWMPLQECSKYRDLHLSFLLLLFPLIRSEWRSIVRKVSSICFRLLCRIRSPDCTRSVESKKPPIYIRWAVGGSNWRVIVTRTRESHPRFILDGTLALLRQVAVSDYGQLLMLKLRKQSFILNANHLTRIAFLLDYGESENDI
jgi:hypothetical protein